MSRSPPSSAARRRGPAGSSSSSTSACRSATASRRRSSAAASRRSGSRRRRTTTRRAASRHARAARPTRFLRLGRASESILGVPRRRHRARGRARQGTSTWGAASSAAGRSSSCSLTALVPFLVGAIDLFARSRRRRLPLRGGLARAPRRGSASGSGSGSSSGSARSPACFPRGSAIPPPPGQPRGQRLARRRRSSSSGCSRRSAGCGRAGF